MSETPSTEESLFRLSKLAALSLVKELPQVEQIALLLSAGFTPNEVADLLDTTPATVRAAKARKRSTGKRRKS